MIYSLVLLILSIPDKVELEKYYISLRDLCEVVAIFVEIKKEKHIIKIKIN